MDPREALKILESARPGTSDLNEPELAEAAALLAQSDDLRREFDDRQELDVRISEAMLQVDVPAGLKDRLLAVVNTADPTTASEPAGNVRQKSMSGSRRTMIAAVAACLMIAASLVLDIGGGRTDIAFDELGRKVPVRHEDLASLPAFDGSFPLPTINPNLAGMGLPKGWSPDPGQPHMLAVYSSTGQTPWTLIVAPSESITNRQAAAAAVGTGISIGGRKYQVKILDDDNYAYVLFVEGRQSDLRRVHTQLFGTSV